MSNETPAAPLTEEQRQAQAAAAGAAHREKFAASADDGTPVAPAAEAPKTFEKPEHVPEKFFDASTGVVNYEAWNKAHTELETKFHSGSKETPSGESEETPAGDKPAAEGASETPEQKAVLATPAAQKAAENYAANGALADSDYTALEAQGITRDMADAYIAGKEAAAKTLTDAAYGPAGGAEQYAEMIAWAKTNLEPASIKAFNTQVSSGDPDVIRNAVTALAAAYGTEATVEGERTGGTGAPATSSTFASRSEMTAAINKLGADGRRLYDVDPAYRNEVARKIGRSRNAGTVNF